MVERFDVTLRIFLKEIMLNGGKSDSKTNKSRF